MTEQKITILEEVTHPYTSLESGDVVEIHYDKTHETYRVAGKGRRPGVVTGFSLIRLPGGWEQHLFQSTCGGENPETSRFALIRLGIDKDTCQTETTLSTSVRVYIKG